MLLDIDLNPPQRHDPVYVTFNDKSKNFKMLRDAADNYRSESILYLGYSLRIRQYLKMTVTYSNTLAEYIDNIRTDMRFTKRNMFIYTNPIG